MTIMTGNVFNIQRFSIHNGPGIRTTVFFKGCPLSCVWCHNSEGLDFAPSAGQIFSMADIMQIIQRDSVFYEESGGGVTFSGGECMAQIDFLAELAQQCKNMGLHVTIDTSGHVPWQNFKRILNICDLFLYDIKITEPVLHKKMTGQGNNLIMENLEKLSKTNAKIWLRFPIIGEINTDLRHVKELSKVCRNIKHEQVNLLPYHAMAGKMQGMRPPTATELAEIKNQLMKATNAKIIVGG